MLKSDAATSRLEVITETGRRRWFSKGDKARIVEETLAPGAVVSDIARRHGLTPQPSRYARVLGGEGRLRRGTPVGFQIDLSLPVALIG
jgi:transposase-like protein